MYRMVVGMTMCIGVMIVTGCTTTQEQTADYVESGTSSVNQITRAIYASARAQVTGELGPLDADKAAFETFKSQQRSQFAAIRKEIKEQQLKLDGFLNAFLDVAATAVPGLSLAQGAARNILNRIQETGAEADSAVDTAKDEMKALIDENKGGIAEAETRLTDVERTLDDVTTEGVKDIDLERAINQLSKEAKELNEADQERLRTQLLDELEKANLLQDATFQKEFKEELIKATKEMVRSPEEIKKIAAMSPGEAFAAYGAGGTGGIVGLMALLRTFGKSRGREELEKLREEFQREQIKRATEALPPGAVLQPQPTAPSTAPRTG